VIRDKYVQNGSVQLVYRDFAFLGDESVKASEAAMCAEDQGKFWEYHDYLFTHQKGENQGNFSIANLKSFAATLGLDKTAFATCLDSGKYAQAITDAKTEAASAGVTGTPKGFILVNGKIVDTIDGYLPLSAVEQKIDAALK
jgi:protein-disulfide isomerase